MSELIQTDIQDIIDGVGVELSELCGKTVLISGACGFLGSWFIAVIQELNKTNEPCTVVAIDSFVASHQRNHIVEVTDENIHFIKGDISDPEVLKEILVDYPEINYIIHAAGIASPIYYRKYPIHTIDGMVLGLSNLLKYSVRNECVKGFLNFSSSEMYGNPHQDFVPTPETYNGNVSATGPRSCYDESKRMGEAMCVAYHNIHEVPVVSVRPFNVYGGGMRIMDDRVVPKFMFQALQGEKLSVHLPSTQTRTFCYVTDAMVGFFKALLLGEAGQAYNIGNESPEITMQELAVRVKTLVDNSELVKEKVIIDYLEMPPEYPRDQAQRRCPDLTKARAGLKYVPSVTLDKGLEKMLQWCYGMLKIK